MPKRRHRIPKYRHYKPKGLGVVRINGKDEYLGKYHSPESWEKYHRLIAEWLSNGQQPAPAAVTPTETGPCLSINEVVLAYWRFAKTYYSKEGKPTKELSCVHEALQPLQQLYGRGEAEDFGPKSLKAVRQHMVKSGLSRGLINRRIGRIKRVFKWAVAEELISPSVLHGLQAVTGLRYGRSDAREAEPIKPVAEKCVQAIRPHVSPQVSAMIHVHWLTGMRACEVVVMRPCDIDMSTEIWIYEPYDHKNRWRGQNRKIPLGPQAQAILKPFLNRPPTAFLFSPREAEARRHAQQRAQRKTPMTPSQIERKAKRKPKRPKRDRYDTHSYRGAIKYGIAKANKLAWIPTDRKSPKGFFTQRSGFPRIPPNGIGGCLT